MYVLCCNSINYKNKCFTHWLLFSWHKFGKLCLNLPNNFRLERIRKLDNQISIVRALQLPKTIARSHQLEETEAFVVPSPSSYALVESTHKPVQIYCKQYLVQQYLEYMNRFWPVTTVNNPLRIRVIVSGGSTYKSFRRPPPPPTGPNSFVFTYVFTEKHLCQRLVPPPMRVGAPPMRNPGSAPDRVIIMTEVNTDDGYYVILLCLDYIDDSYMQLLLFPFDVTNICYKFSQNHYICRFCRTHNFY